MGVDRAHRDARSPWRGRFWAWLLRRDAWASWCSGEIEQGWKYGGHQRCPGRVDGQEPDLPALERRKRSAVAQEPPVTPRRPQQVDQQNEILAERRHAIR